ncbi:hypothetical protein D3C80_1536410 [compost metagenome]
MGQALALGEEEGRAHLRLQAVEHARDAFQQFQQHLAGFRRRGLRLRQMGDGFQVGALQFLAAPVVDHQAARDGAQEGARGAQLQQVGAQQHTQEGVLREVGGIGGVAQLAAQPTVQPAMVLAIERLDGKGMG